MHNTKVWKFFTSIKLTVLILVSLAVTSIAGTFIPQNKNPGEYLETYGQFLYNFFDLLNLFNMYQSWWFRSLLALLCVNIIICSYERLKSTWKIIFPKIPTIKISKKAHCVEFQAGQTPTQLKSRYQELIKTWFGYSRMEETSDGYIILAEKGRWTGLGVYLVHASIVLMLAGGLLGSIFGFEGYVNISEGEHSKTIRLKSLKPYDLDFAIQCDDFSITYYESGEPKEYRSKLTIIENKHNILTQDIIVNQPLRYQGINIYQSNYGTLPSGEITLKVISTESGMEYPLSATMGKPVELPEKKGVFILTDFMQDFNFGGRHLGSTYTGILTTPAGGKSAVSLPLRFPAFDKMRQGELFLTVMDYKSIEYTGLQITSDPGQGLVYIGFVVIIIGFIIAFFISHQKICIKITAHHSGSMVIVTGTANKNKTRMHKKIDQMSKKLNFF